MIVVRRLISRMSLMSGETFVWMRMVERLARIYLSEKRLDMSHLSVERIRIRSHTGYFRENTHRVIHFLCGQVEGLMLLLVAAVAL